MRGIKQYLENRPLLFKMSHAENVMVVVFRHAVMECVEKMMETMTFALYLVLASKPRIDDSNLIDYYSSQEHCVQIAEGLNENYEYLWPDKEHNMVYVCREKEKDD